MPTTTKGLPYPASTAPPNVPADLAALAQDLDFTKIPLLTAVEIPGANTLLSAYPLGLSLLNLSSAESSAGGWPGGAPGHVLTVKGSAGRAAQLFYRNGLPLAWYRGLVADPGPHTAWVAATGPYAQAQGAATVTLTANPTPSVVVTLPAGRFTQAPRVQLTPNSSLWMPAMISGSVTATSFALIARNILATTGTGTADVHWLATQATSAATDG